MLDETQEWIERYRAIETVGDYASFMAFTKPPFEMKEAFLEFKKAYDKFEDLMWQLNV